MVILGWERQHSEQIFCWSLQLATVARKGRARHAHRSLFRAREEEAIPRNARHQRTTAWAGLCFELELTSNPSASPCGHQAESDFVGWFLQKAAAGCHHSWPQGTKTAVLTWRAELKGVISLFRSVLTGLCGYLWARCSGNPVSVELSVQLEGAGSPVPPPMGDSQGQLFLPF